MLSRMRELAVQASTDTLNNTDRASIDLEYQALKNEVNRIVNATQYNEMNVLNVKGISAYEQEVANAKQTMEAAQIAKSDAETTLSQAKIILAETQSSISSSRTTAFSQAQTMFGGAVQTFENVTGIVAGYEGYKDLENLAPLAQVEAEENYIHPINPVNNINDEDFGTRWNAKNDDVDTWVKFNWENTQKINRIHLHYPGSRISEDTIEYNENLTEVEGLIKTLENADTFANYPHYLATANGYSTVRLLTFDTVNTNVLQYHVTETRDKTLEPTLWEIEIFFDPKVAYIQPQKKVESVKTAFDSAQATLSSPEVSNADIVSSLDNAETLLDDAISALNALGNEDIESGDLSSVLNEFNSLKTAYSGMKTMLQDADSQLTQLATDVSNAESTLATRESELATAQTALTDAETVLASIHSSSKRTFQIGADNDINNQLDFNLVDATTETIGVDGTDVVNLDSARSSITALDHATDIINSERSRLGSLQNKLQFTMSNLTSQTQSIEAARSSIQDTDFAADAADLAKNQILAQSGTAMLAQASALPQNILSLLS